MTATASFCWLRLPMCRAFLLGIAFFAAFFSTSAFAADPIPDWVRQTAEAPVPGYSTKVTSVHLFHEEAVTIDPDGRRVMRERGAIKLLQSGEKLAAVRYYDGKAGRIRDFQGWVLLPGAKPIAIAKNRVADFSPTGGEVFDEYRGKALECGCNIPGSIFFWEVTEEERSIFTQDSFAFQGHEPALWSRYSVTLPASWEAKGLLFNHANIDPQVFGTTYTWELKDLPYIEEEEYSPSISALAPRLVVSFFPPTDNRAGLQGLKDWASVSTWLSPLVDPPAEVTSAIAAKAAQLTANAATELDKIRALAAFVQQTNYVEVDLNLTRAGGYTPRSAADTLSRNYGDCKDKATLLRALLKSVGIQSHLVTITSGNRNYVRPEWASPRQFNHAIIGIEVSDAVKLATVLEDAGDGRLLIFDPTDRITPVGDLPQSEQGSYALIIAGPKGALRKMPELPLESRRVESTASGTVDAEGNLAASIERQYFGQSSTRLRYVEKTAGAAELKKVFERGFTRAVGGTTIANIATETSEEQNRMSVKLDLTALRFGQSMQGRLFVVRPGILASGGQYYFRSRQRTNPVQLDAQRRHETIRLKLPAGFKVDELPAPAKLEGPYGSLEVSWAVRDGEAVMDQTLEVRPTMVPIAEYAKVRDFFDKVAGAQDAPIVLVKQ